MNSLDVILEKISTIQRDISAIQVSIQTLNDHSGETAINLATLTTRLDTIEKFLWLIIGTSVAAIVGTAWSLVLHKRNGQK